MRLRTQCRQPREFVCVEVRHMNLEVGTRSARKESPNQSTGHIAAAEKADRKHLDAPCPKAYGYL